jgi:hypothetical protein
LADIDPGEGADNFGWEGTLEIMGVRAVRAVVVQAFSLPC